jgi:phosphoglycerate dehydrogenase-like enzyme
MNVIGCVERPTPSVNASLQEKGIRLTDFAEVVATSDFVSLHVPLKDSTRNLFNVTVLASMKPGAYLINLARGGVVDEQALYNALVDGRLSGAALDVHKEEGDGKISPLADLNNVLLTPHIGAGTRDSQREIGERIIEIVGDFSAKQVESNPLQALVVA